MRSPKRADALLVIVLALLLAIPTIHTLAVGPALCVAGPSDTTSYFLAPVRGYARAMREHGAPPLWFPDQLFGCATLGDPQQRILYPPMLLYAVFALPTAHELLWLFHAIVLGASVYALLRGERCAPLAAFAGAVMIGACLKRFTYELAGWDNVFGAVAWTPLVLLFWRRGLRARGARDAVFMGAAVALSCLAGTPLFAAYLALGLAITGAIEVARRRARARRVARATILGFAIGLAFAAPQLLPALELSRDTARAALPESYGTTLALRDALAALAAPDLSHANFSWETSNDLGVFALPFAAVAVALARRRARFAIALLPLFLVFASAWGTPIGALWLSLPFLRALSSHPTRLVWIAAIAEAFLAGAGVDALLRMSGPRRRARAAIGFACGAIALLFALPLELDALAPIALALALACSLPFVVARLRRPIVVALVALTAIELIATAEHALERVPYAALAAPTPIDEALRKEPHARFAAITRDAWDEPVVPLYEAEGVERADGYNPLHTRAVAELEDVVSGRAPLARWNAMRWIGGDRGDVRWDLLALGVTHVVSSEPIPGLAPIASATRPIYMGGWRDATAVLARVPDAMPRAYLMTSFFPLEAQAHAQRMSDRSFDPRRTLLVELDYPPEYRGPYLDRTEAGPLPVEILRHDAERVELRARAPRGKAGFVVLLDAWSKDWTATVDGVPASIWRANALFRAVQIGEGEHTVVMTIHLPFAFWLGVVIAAIAGIASFALFLVETRRARSGAKK